MKTAAKHRAKIRIDVPEGVEVIERPDGLDLLTRTKNKWMGVVQNLETLDNTKCVTLSLGDLMDMRDVNHKAKLNSIKSSIKHTAQTMGFKAKIKFALKDNKLYIWA